MHVYDFGPNATTLPGPHDITEFDPTQHLLIEDKGIAEIPGYPGSLVRWHPRKPDMIGIIPTSGPAIESHIIRAQQHLQAIRTVSGGTLEVPSHRSFVAPNPYDPGRLAIMTIVERIEGVSHTSTTTAPETATALYGLALYLGWVVATRQPEILSDAFSSKQLVTRGHQNYIVDVDAVLSSAPTNPKYMQRYADRLTAWRHRLPDVPYATAAEAILGRVQGGIHTSASAKQQGAPPYNVDYLLPAIQDITNTLAADSD